MAGHPGTVSRGDPGPRRGGRVPFISLCPYTPTRPAVPLPSPGRGFEREGTGIVTWTKLLKKNKKLDSVSSQGLFQGLRRARELRFVAPLVLKVVGRASGRGPGPLLPSARTLSLLSGGPADPAPSRAPRMRRGG